jgi:dihydroxyacetone kinase-like protein
LIEKQDVLNFIELTAAKMKEHRQELTDLDQAIGDGDHGINMDRGFKAVMEQMPALEEKNVGDILKQVGMILVSKVGGASGPLYGTAFMKAGMAMKGKEEMNDEDLIVALEAAADGIKARGKATTGEKTMLDSLMPAVSTLKKNFGEGALTVDALIEAEQACWEGVEYTKTIIATKGRASYLGERSIGHQDPGATSMTYIFQAAKEVSEGKN